VAKIVFLSDADLQRLATAGCVSQAEVATVQNTALSRGDEEGYIDHTSAPDSADADILKGD
jgi:hypothetical protein